ncbi:MAG: gamma-glutamyl-gamma-aminobutyrate hydrolase family protein [Deltaproteobacteria bacterium]|nr:gamma-glutamyl-gamma-aminobutyrate hydrolase family protein [Nannocystaceae bacterium]
MAERRNEAPLIGISCEAVSHEGKTFRPFDLVCDHRYSEAVNDAGGHPVLLPIAYRKNTLRRYLEGIDGLVIVGGDDVDPRLFGEEPGPGTTVIYPQRTTFETWLYEAGKSRQLPILAICYGMQLINVLEGGSLHQEIPQRKNAPRIDHRGQRRQAHWVRIIPGTRLYEITDCRWSLVATEHHQAVHTLAPGFIPSAVADDGIIEAIENPDMPQILAVQWHPERRRHSIVTRRLFRRFIALAKAYKSRK